MGDLSIGPEFLPCFAVASMVRFFPPKWVPASSPIFVPFFFLQVLTELYLLPGEGKRRNEFAEWHVAWLAE